MDEVVLRSMAKWPNVPAVYGWLALDRRGRWLVRGEPIGNAATRRFIGRNYGVDDRGRWYFQNGPQRVYVRLECTPWVYRIGEAGALETHTGRPVERIDAAWVDDSFNLLVCTEHGPGLVEDRDLATLAGALCDAAGRVLDDRAAEAALGALAAGRGSVELYLQWGGSRTRVGFVPAAELAQRLGFDPDPVAPREDAGGAATA